jgi:hypothetical protein
MTLGPIAVYNAMMFDRDLDKGGKPVIAFLDIGTRASDLVVIEDGRCWTRTFPIGGHHFTEAIAAAFGVPYSKADRLKAEAATHKYAKQLMHAMRPVFDDLLQEVQRSMGHYQSLHPDKPVAQVIGLGSTFRIPGLRKFLSDQLQVEIRRLEEFEKIKVEGSAAGDFAANAMNLSTAIGLALQGLGFSEISINLSPVGNLREQVWGKKAKWFIAAAILMCLGSAALFYRPGGEVGKDVPGIVTRVKNKGQESIKKFEEVKQSADDGQRANNMLFLLEDRKVWPWIVSDVNAAIDSTGAVDKDRLKDKLVSGAWDGTGEPPVPYESWSTIELLQLGGKYKFVASPTPHRTVDVTMRIVVPRDGKSAKQFVQQTVLAWLNENADRKDAPYKIIIPAAGIVPEFAPLNAAPGADGTKSSGGSSGADDFQQPETSGSDEGAGNVQGRNKSEVLITTKGGTLGGAGFGSSGGAGGADPIESGSDSGGAGQEGSQGEPRCDQVLVGRAGRHRARCRAPVGTEPIRRQACHHRHHQVHRRTAAPDRPRHCSRRPWGGG